VLFCGVAGEIMLLCMLPVTLTLATLAADAGDAAADKWFALRPVDPLTRRSAMDKNFMRFGRAFDCWTAPAGWTAMAAAVKRRDPAAAVGRRLDSNFIRFGRQGSNFIRFGRRDSSNFIRFGRGEVYAPGDNKIPRRHNDVDVDGMEVRFGRSAATAVATTAATDRSRPFAALPYDRR